MRSTIIYTVIRIALFAAICAVLVLFGVNPFLSAAIAAIASLVISYFAFARVRGRMAVELASRGARNARDEVITRDSDTDAEDEALDRAEASASREGTETVAAEDTTVADDSASVAEENAER